MQSKCFIQRIVFYVHSDIKIFKQKMEIVAETKEIEKMNWMDLKLMDGFNSNIYTVVSFLITKFSSAL